MDAAFPFGFPAPTAFYLTLQVLTFALHQAFMHYVMAGSLYVGWTIAFPGSGSVPRSQQPLAAILLDWMPFLLSAAITAGIAPLLFVQILYQREFYTANLLLSFRWLIVIPVLIAAFYLLYVIKSAYLPTFTYMLRVAVVLGTAACFVFVGFCWTANHLLGNSEAKWPEIYQTGVMPFAASVVVPRMLVWIGGAFATMAVFVGWQLTFYQSCRIHNDGPGEGATLARLALGGIVVASGAGTVYVLRLDGEAKKLLFGNIGLPYLILTVVGIVLQAMHWAAHLRSGHLCGKRLTMATVGIACSLVGVSVEREILRLHELNVPNLLPRHAEAAEIGGFGVFVVCALFTGGLMIYCVWIVFAGRQEKVE